MRNFVDIDGLDNFQNDRMWAEIVMMSINKVTLNRDKNSIKSNGLVVYLFHEHNAFDDSHKGTVDHTI